MRRINEFISALTNVQQKYKQSKGLWTMFLALYRNSKTYIQILTDH